MAKCQTFLLSCFFQNPRAPGPKASFEMSWVTSCLSPLGWVTPGELITSPEEGERKWHFFEHLFCTSHSPRIFPIYGLIQSPPFAFKKDICTPVLYTRNFSLREIFTKPPAITKAFFIVACSLPNTLAKPHLYFIVLNSEQP